MDKLPSFKLKPDQPHTILCSVAGMLCTEKKRIYMTVDTFDFDLDFEDVFIEIYLKTIYLLYRQRRQQQLALISGVFVMLG